MDDLSRKNIRTPLFYPIRFPTGPSGVFAWKKAPSARFLKSIPHAEGALHGHFSFLSANSRSTANNTGYKTAAMTHTIHVLCQSLLGREITRYKAVTTLQ